MDGNNEFPTGHGSPSINPLNISAHPNSPYYERTSTPIGCRSSANYVSAAMSKFDEQKKVLVRSIGFGGLLELHEMTKVNRVFSHWLLSITNWEDGVISTGQHTKIKLVSEDIEKILGIPAIGRDVLSSALKEEDKVIFREKHLSFLGPESSMIDTAERIIQKDLPMPMSKKDEDQFKIAFVVFVMARFLAPTTVFNQGNYNYWHALANPDEIKEFNWSSYVLSCLLDSARVVFFGNLMKKKVASVTGCPLVLQIFYLDNVDLGHLNMRHDVFPRIKVFNSSILNRMIEADTDKVSAMFGCSKLRSRHDSCYALPESTEAAPHHTQLSGREHPSPTLFQRKRRYTSTSATQKSCSSTDGAIIGTSPIICRSIGANFPAYIRSKYPDFVQDPFIEALRYHNARCLQHINKHKNALTSAIVYENMTLADKYVEQHAKQSTSGIPKYPKKFSQRKRKNYEEFLSGPESGSEAEEQQYQSPRESHSHQEQGPCKDYRAPLKNLSDHHCLNTNPILDCNRAGPSNPDFQASDIAKEGNGFQTPAASSKMPPITPQVSQTEANKMHSDYALTLRLLTSIVDVDLNTRTIDAEYNISPIAKKVVRTGRFARSHWSLGVDHPERDPSVTASLYEWVSTTNSNELDRSWIIHDIPRYILCKGHDVKKDFFSDSGLSYDLFDIFVRRLLQIDNQIYPADSPLRWRHILESDFAMHVLGGENPSTSKSVRDQFVGPGVCSELHRCRMLFIPVQGKGVWWCYAIDLRETNVFIIDPSVDNHKTADVLAKHNGTIKMIIDSLQTTVISLFDGRQIPSDDFDNVVVKTTTSGCPRSVSAFYTLYCMKNFEGDNTIHVSENNINNFKQAMMYELFGLKDNRGNLPSVYVQTIDD